MDKKTELYESLSSFVDAVAYGDQDAERESMSAYISEKSKKTLEASVENKIKLEGDDVIIAGKKIGSITNDIDDETTGIKFVSTDGKFEEDFDTLDSMYKFVSEKYKVNEDAINEESQIARVSPAVSKQEAGRAARMKRLADSKNLGNKDGKAGTYDGGQKDGYDDPIKGDNSPAHSGHETDARNKKGYYDSKDPRKVQKDPIKGGSEPAHAGGASDLETDGGYDAHDVRKEHSKNAQK